MYSSKEIVIDLQTEIKLLIKKSIFRVREMQLYKKRVEKLVDERLAEIDDLKLRSILTESMLKFAKDEFEKLSKHYNFGNMPLIVAYAGLKLDTVGLQEEINRKMLELPVRRLESGFTHLASSTPKVNRNGVYGYVEMWDRREETQKKLSELKKKTNLIIVGTHANCSDRCFPWQGKVYSLDGTSGITKDGRKYIPLEVATSAKDKYGNVNGLYGFNCRHQRDTVAYQDGLQPVKVSKKEQQREYNINNKQRLYERNIREMREKGALSLEGKEYRKKAAALRKEYEQFCKDNGVVAYRSRLKIFNQQ